MIIPKSIDIRKTGYFCIHCFSPISYPAVPKSRLCYECKSCGYSSDRCLVTGGKIIARLDENRKLWHTSVGVAFITPHQQLLCIERAFYPRALALPAGHIEVGEEPLCAAVREVREELGLSIRPSVLEVLPEFDLIDDSCRRGSDHHHWYLYAASCDSSIMDSISSNDEAARVTLVDISSADDRSDFTPALRQILSRWGSWFRQRARPAA